MKSTWGLSLLPLLAVGSPVVVDTIHNDAAPIVSASNAESIADSYMVVLKKHVDGAKAIVHQSWVQDIHLDNQNVRTELRKRDQTSLQESAFEGLKHTYSMPGMIGYSGHFHEDVIDQIRNHPDVDFIERDSVVTIQRVSGSDSESAYDEPELERNAPWGLARISHRQRLGFANFNKYLYSEDGGEGVDAYVIDTGTYTDHVDFEGRAHWGKTIPNNSEDVDGNGHGTHCSGTIAGKKFGVAKKANVYAVKVLGSNGSGTMSDVVKGIEWVTLSHQKKVKDAKDGKVKGFKGSVANMSLGGGKSPITDMAVNAAVDVGVHFAVAAGNDNGDACNSSPAAAEKAITVCASTLSDERAYFSNYGKCTDIFAPGLNIPSAWIGSPYAVNTISGTSMASPHICGLLAYFLSLQPAADSAFAVDEITPKKLKAALAAVSTKNTLTDVPSDTPNLLAWNGGGVSNLTDIIKKGGYDAKASFSPKDYVRSKTHHLKAELKEIVAEIEELIEEY